MTDLERRKKQLAEEFDEMLAANGYTEKYGKVNWENVFAWIKKLVETFLPIILPLFTDKSDPLEKTP